MSDAEQNRRHAEKMAKIKAARDKMMAGKTRSKGLLIVHTGKGKGKTTAAMGMVMRAVGRGMKTGVVQFIKGAQDTGEKLLLDRFPELCTFKVMGEGFTWDTQDRARDIAAARAGWQAALEMLGDSAYGLVLLDELNICLRYDYLPLGEVLAALAARPADMHVIITGRGAPGPLIEAADLVSEMTLIKHPFRAGVKAQPGIEF